MTRRRWLAGRALEALGVRGLIGLGSLAASVLLYQIVIVPDSTHLENTRAEAAELSRQLPGRGGAPGLQDPGERLDAFYRFFPGAASLPELLDKVYAAAAQRSVALEQGEYRLTRERGGRLARYQVILPVRASYPQIRGFVEDVLERIPAAALESISFKREAASADGVEAQIRFTLFLGET